MERIGVVAVGVESLIGSLGRHGAHKGVVLEYVETRDARLDIDPRIPGQDEGSVRLLDLQAKRSGWRRLVG